MFLARCRERDDEKMSGKFGDCFKTANVESCMMLTYVKDFIPKYSHISFDALHYCISRSVLMIGWRNWSYVEAI